MQIICIDVNEYFTYNATSLINIGNNIMFKYSPQDQTFEVLTNFGKNKTLVAQFKAQSVATDAWSIICHRDFVNEVQFIDSLNGQLGAAINLTDSEHTIRQAAKHAYRKMILKGKRLVKAVY